MDKHKENPIEILVTINQNYIKPLEVMLYSMRLNNPQSHFRIWVIYEDISDAALNNLKGFTDKIGLALKSLAMNQDFQFPQSLINLHDYPKEMYFRLLCGNILPASLHKIIYLDPDILIINSIAQLWNLDLKGNMFAASVHEGLTDIMSSINNIRLGTKYGYFNSGIMVMDLDKMRKMVKLRDISAVINKHHDALILPDQDILNYLYGKYILKIPETRWNYDARAYSIYLVKSSGKYNLEWVMKNTSILHFCGKPKPWQDKNNIRFKALYLNYQQIVNKLIASQ